MICSFKQKIFKFTIKAGKAIFCLLVFVSFAEGQTTIPNYVPLKENVVTGTGCEKVASSPVYNVTSGLETIPFQINLQGYEKSQQELSMKYWDVIIFQTRVILQR